MTTQTITLSIRRAIRQAAGATQANIPVEVIPGSDIAPRKAGESWHYETRGGRRIYHPSAYSKNGWSNMVYVASTRRVEVGELWLAGVR